MAVGKIWCLLGAPSALSGRGAPSAHTAGARRREAARERKCPLERPMVGLTPFTPLWSRQQQHFHLPSTRHSPEHARRPWTRVLRCAHTRSPFQSMRSLAPCALLPSTRHSPEHARRPWTRVLRCVDTRTWFLAPHCNFIAPTRAHPCGPMLCSFVCVGTSPLAC